MLSGSHGSEVKKPPAAMIWAAVRVDHSCVQSSPSKSGPLACGLPIMLNNFIPCQEAGNIPWVIDNQVGDYSNEPDEVASIVLGWFKKGLKQMRKRAFALGRPEATYEIVDDLVELCIKKTRWEPFKNGGMMEKDLSKFAVTS